MLGSWIALGLMILMAVTKDAGYAIAAGLFELAGVLYTVTRPRRFKEKPLKMVNGQWVEEVPKHDTN